MHSSQTSIQSLGVRVMPTFTDAGPSAGHPRAPVRVLATLDFDSADRGQAQKLRAASLTQAVAAAYLTDYFVGHAAKLSAWWPTCKPSARLRSALQLGARVIMP